MAQMMCWKELNKGDLIFTGDQRLMADGTWKECEYWPGRRVEGGFFRRLRPCGQRIPRKQEFRLAKVHDFGAVCVFSNSPMEQWGIQCMWEHDIENSYYLATLKDIYFGTLPGKVYTDSKGNTWNFAWVPVE